MKNDRVNQISARMQQLQDLRDKQREDDLERRRQQAKKEADDINKKTLKAHERAKMHE